jgi:hypothetical protein
MSGRFRNGQLSRCKHQRSPQARLIVASLFSSLWATPSSSWSAAPRSVYTRYLCSLAHISSVVFADCPKCAKLVERDGGCNLMTCVCGQHFCWVRVGRQISLSLPSSLSHPRALGLLSPPSFLSFYLCRFACLIAPSDLRCSHWFRPHLDQYRGPHLRQVQTREGAGGRGRTRRAEAIRILLGAVQGQRRYAQGEGQAQATAAGEGMVGTKRQLHSVVRGADASVQEMKLADRISTYETKWLSRGLAQVLECRRVLAHSYVFAYYMFGKEMPFSSRIDPVMQRCHFTLFSFVSLCCSSSSLVLSSFVSVVLIRFPLIFFPQPSQDSL